MKKRLLAFLLLLSLLLTGCIGGIPETEAPETPAETWAESVSEDEWYSAYEDVALYIHLYGHLPDNYVTKKQAEKAGWVSSKGNLWDVLPDHLIGGDKFGNREGLLPARKGRTYYECDVDFRGDYNPKTKNTRGTDRIIFSNDGLVYYTDDHYASFTLLYGEP